MLLLKNTEEYRALIRIMSERDARNAAKLLIERGNFWCYSTRMDATVCVVAQKEKCTGIGTNGVPVAIPVHHEPILTLDELMKSDDMSLVAPTKKLATIAFLADARDRRVMSGWANAVKA
jgi:hypothetical protein